MHFNTAAAASLLLSALPLTTAYAIVRRADNTTAKSLIADGDFESDPVTPSPWTLTPGGSQSFFVIASPSDNVQHVSTTSRIVHGKCNGSFPPGNPTTGAAVFQDSMSISQAVTVEPGATYKVSVDVIGFMAPNTSIQVMWNDQQIISAPFDGNTALPNHPPIDTWTTVRGTVTADPAATSGTIKVVWFCDRDESNDIYIDNVVMVKQ